MFENHPQMAGHEEWLDIKTENGHLLSMGTVYKVGNKLMRAIKQARAENINAERRKGNG